MLVLWNRVILTAVIDVIDQSSPFFPLRFLLSIAVRSECLGEYECDVDEACPGALTSGTTTVPGKEGAAVVLSAVVTVMVVLIAAAVGVAI